MEKLTHAEKSDLIETRYLRAIGKVMKGARS